MLLVMFKWYEEQGCLLSYFLNCFRKHKYLTGLLTNIMVQSGKRRHLYIWDFETTIWRPTVHCVYMAKC